MTNVLVNIVIKSYPIINYFLEFGSKISYLM